MVQRLEGDVWDMRSWGQGRPRASCHLTLASVGGFAPNFNINPKLIPDLQLGLAHSRQNIADVGLIKNLEVCGNG